MKFGTNNEIDNQVVADTTQSMNIAPTVNNVGTAPTGVISLAKGQKIDLTKGNLSLNKICIGLGWDTNKYVGGADFDLDASVFMLDKSGKCEEKGFIFYNNLIGHGVKHMGDNRTGVGDGDDEQITVTFSEVSADVEKIAVAVTIFDHDVRCQNFGMVSNSYVRVVDMDTDRELCRFDLGEDFSVETAVVVCELYRHNGEWKFNAIGSGFEGGLRALCLNYGLNV